MAKLVKITIIHSSFILDFVSDSSVESTTEKVSSLDCLSLIVESISSKKPCDEQVEITDLSDCIPSKNSQQRITEIKQIGTTDIVCEQKPSNKMFSLN